MIHLVITFLHFIIKFISIYVDFICISILLFLICSCFFFINLDVYVRYILFFIIAYWSVNRVMMVIDTEVSLPLRDASSDLSTMMLTLTCKYRRFITGSKVLLHYSIWIDRWGDGTVFIVSLLEFKVCDSCCLI